MIAGAPKEVQSVFGEAMKHVEGLTKNAMTVEWKAKELETLPQLEEFLNDGKKIVRLNITERNNGLLLVVYAVPK